GAGPTYAAWGCTYTGAGSTYTPGACTPREKNTSLRACAAEATPREPSSSAATEMNFTERAFMRFSFGLAWKACCAGLHERSLNKKQSGAGQRNIHPGAAQVGAPQLQFALVAGHEFVDHGQPDAMPRHAFIAADMKLQHRLRIAESRPVIVDLDPQPVTIVPDAHGHAVTGPLGGVVHHVTEQLEGIAFIDAPAQVGRTLERERQAFAGMDLRQRIADPVHDRCQCQQRHE